jgi:ADP-ribose pyrophosphatase YjhB (NUDIX family)
MDKFCKYCGTKHSDTKYPKKCDNCTQMTWINPAPVAVILQPVIGSIPDNDRSAGNQVRVGILIGRRTINPMKGHWGLVGGFIDCDDHDVIEAARREFLEETGFEAPSGEHMSLVGSFSDARHLLVFVESHEALHEGKLSKFVPNSECDAIRVAWTVEELCFESNTRELKKYFDRWSKEGKIEVPLPTPIVAYNE